MAEGWGGQSATLGYGSQIFLNNRNFLYIPWPDLFLVGFEFPKFPEVTPSVRSSRFEAFQMLGLARCTQTEPGAGCHSAAQSEKRCQFAANGAQQSSNHF